MDSPKSLQLEICEKHEGALPLSMTVVDKDTGDNALFDLKLEGKYATAFQVIPNAGYKTAEFQILVTNSSKLDYENPEWKNINFEILSTGQNTIKKDTYSLSITLKDWNDEYPKFEEEIYNFKIKESIAKGEIVGSVKAIDTDDGDVITYNIIGNNKLSINSDGKIYVNEDNAFDFDILESVIFQVSAIDKASHVSSPPAQVTIKIIDENNKKPVITANGVINIEENQKTGYKLDASITAIKTFKESKLTAHIDWEKSSVKWHFQDKPITKEMKCVNLKITDEHTPTLSMSLVMNQDGPDYETFDTINLFIVVTDENVDEKFLDAKEASTIIVISVEDVNDNPPIFTDDTLTTNRTVTEGNGKSTSAGVIQASDKDVDSKIVYSISSTTEFDWIGVDQNTGALSVLDTVIDADTNQLYYLYYNIKANDGLLEDDKNIKIYIIDKNNKEPTILNLKENNIIAVNEEEPKDTTFFDISYEDKDRDEAYKTVKCEITHDDCKKYFKIDYNKGVNKIAMQDKYTRESINENHPCSIRCYDNPDGNVDNQQSTSIKSFTITLMDINNNIPKIPILKYEANENILKDGIITTIEAIDPDKGENGTVSFLLLSAKKDQENVDLFSIHEIGDNKANLIATQSLEDQYGEYTIEIKVSDHGQSLQNNDTFILTLTVNKYNFRPPRFIFPDSAITRTLKVEQNVNEPLKLSTTDDTLEDIEVSYLPDKPCGDKFKYKIEIKDGNEKDVFKLKTLANCKSQLQITEKYKQDNDQTYSLKISATLEDFLPDEPSGTSEATLKIRFFEVTDPYFIDTSPMTIKMFEVQNGQTSSLNFTATYGESDVDEKTDIYYYILEKTNITEFFKVTGNKENILISQLKDLHYEETSEYSFTIAASKSDVEPNSKLPNSNLPIKVQVIDINNFRPKFPTKKFLKAVVYKIKSTTVVQLNAMDIDTIANTLSYTMGKIVTNGTHIDNILEPFKLDSKTGNINQNFDVAANMQGYFLFDVVVKDQQDDYGNGPWEDSTNVKILILDETNLVVFRFDNNLDDVVTEADQIMDKISETLKYTAQYTSIDEDKESNLILVSVWLIDGDNALLAEDILKKIADVQVFKELKTKLRSFNIQLQSFPTETYVEDLTSVLKTWLIGVSVVLSALCLILLIAFVLKTRQLSQRIKKLTDNKFGSTESNLNRLGVNAPNTNQHAVEGANPVFKNDKKSEDDIYDKKSITSGDSDLIGIEDNADFDLGNFKSERPSFSNNENLNRKTDDEFGDDFDI
ncbi:unnamed protein product [Brassicogethes aeneus]|uniref:Cadherin domain-containing protein n=1 Tax=Brassicogethes aeneus TaxID=1431903 RepID=A0A9P0FJ93_BRAAE|nr:unnamed protein product [Brassicogethes aeneus]